MKDQTVAYQGSFESFLLGMEQGWGFWRAYQPARIGRGLRQLAEAKGVDMSTPVVVEFTKGSYGWGPDFHYTYTWKVRGIELDAAKATPSKTDHAFGFSRRSLASILPFTGGFSVSYEW